MAQASGSRPPYRVAVIGYGIGGAIFHAPLVSAAPGLKLAAIVTRSQEKVEQVKKDYPAVKILASAEAVFATAGDYDLVVVTSPNRYHFPQAKAALEAGLHVVVDKPMTTRSADCLELIELAEKKGKLLTAFHNRRLDGDFLTVKKIIDEKLLGEVVRLESRFDRYRPKPRAGAWRELGSPEEGGGLLLDLGSHLIDQACHIWGMPMQVYCELDRRREGVETDDDCFVALSFESGRRAHLFASVLCRIKGPRFRLSGHLGSYEKFGMDPQEDALRAGIRPGHPAWGKDSQEGWGTVQTEVVGLALNGKIETMDGAYQNFYRQVLAAMQADSPELLPVCARDAYRTALILEAAQRSAAEKSVVGLENKAIEKTAIKSG